MRYKRIFSLLSLVLLCLSAVPLPVRAEEGKWNENNIAYTKFYADNDDCNYVPSGGFNSLGGITAESREETQQLETYLASIGYILVNTNEKQVSDEDVEMLKNYRFCGSSYLDSTDPHFWNYDNYRVYVYEPVFEDLQRQHKEHGNAELYTQIELNASSVLIDYYYWHTIERIGTVVDAAGEINENIPSQAKERAGFVEFTTPIDCEIILYLNDMQYYYRLYLRKGVTLIKLRSERYKIESINAVSMNYGDELIYNGNYLPVYQQPEDDPLKVDITQVVKRDNIGGIDVSGKPEYGWVFEPADIEDLGDIEVDKLNNVEVKEDDTDNGNPEKNTWKFPIFTMLVFAVIGGIVAMHIKKGDRK